MSASRAVDRAAAVLLQPDVQELLRVVPLVERGGGVEPLVALEPDQVSLEHRRQHLGDLGLADAGVPLDQERLAQRGRKVDRGGHRAIGDVALALHRLLDPLDFLAHWASTRPARARRPVPAG